MNHSDIANDPWVQALYEITDDPNQLAHGKCVFHGKNHIQETQDNARALFAAIPLPPMQQEAILIALGLHDVGRADPELSGDNKKNEDEHPEYSYKFALDYLKDKDIPEDLKNEILEAIRGHGTREDKTSLIAAVVYMCDKVFSKQRFKDNEDTREHPVYKNWLLVDSVDFKVDGNKLVVTHNCADGISEDFFTNYGGLKQWDKVHHAVDNVAKLVGLEAEVGFQNLDGSERRPSINRENINAIREQIEITKREKDKA